MAKYDMFGFIIYEFKYRFKYNGTTENIVVKDVNGKTHEIWIGERIYYLSGSVYYHDTCNDQLIRLEMTADEFLNGEIFEHFISL